MDFPPDLHADDCAIVLDGCLADDHREWVEHAHWTDADFCTCYLKAVMARRAIYGDERLVAALPFGPEPQQTEQG